MKRVGQMLDVSAITDKTHRELLDMETIRACGIEEFKRTIVDEALRTLTPPLLPSSQSGFVFVNTDSADRRLAGELSELLYNHGIGYALPLNEGKPSEIRIDLEENLRNCDGLIILYGSTAVTWVRSQLRQSHKIIGQREQPLRCMALCEAPPVPKDEIAFRLPNMVTIDCRNGFSEESLLEFIECLRRSR